MKREPSAEIRNAANGMHELFVSLIDAGFTEPQAIALLGMSLGQANKDNT